MSWLNRFFLIGLFVLSACTSSPDTPMPTAESDNRNCAGLLEGVTEAVVCIDAPPSGMLLQSLEEQATISTGGANLTLDGTLYIAITPGESMTIATIEGVGIVGASGSARIVQPGAQVSVPLDGGLRATGTPTTPVPFDAAIIAAAPLTLLTRPVQLPPPIAAPPGYVAPTTSAPTTTETIQEQETTAECVARADWTATYTIQRGDTLSHIAENYGITQDELQTGNCIDNPNQIYIGQILQLPPGASTIIPTPTASAATPTPSTVFFRADQPTIQTGQCTTLRWDVDNVSAVTFEGETTTGHNARQVCPSETTSYTLRVVYPDGSQSSHNVTITVEGS